MIGDGAVVLETRRRRNPEVPSQRDGRIRKGSMSFLESESEENLVAEPVRMARSAHFLEGPGPLSRNATHDLESQVDGETNADGLHMERPF